MPLGLEWRRVAPVRDRRKRSWIQRRACRIVTSGYPPCRLFDGTAHETFPQKIMAGLAPGHPSRSTEEIRLGPRGVLDPHDADGIQLHLLTGIALGALARLVALVEKFDFFQFLEG